MAREVEHVFERELRQRKTILFSIGLDNDVMDPDEAWAGEIWRERHIGDFRGWQKHDEYTQAFARLMRDLKAASESAAVR